MKRRLLHCLTILVLISCRKENEQEPLLSGTYTGTFQRLVSGNGDTSNVSLTFNINSWSGVSEFIKYPGLCGGSFKIFNSDSIVFENTCVWTADFDGTLILHGSYKLFANHDSVIILKDYGFSKIDLYKLKRN
jgi:hypothetical protein